MALFKVTKAQGEPLPDNLANTKYTENAVLHKFRFVDFEYNPIEWALISVYENFGDYTYVRESDGEAGSDPNVYIEFYLYLEEGLNYELSHTKPLKDGGDGWPSYFAFTADPNITTEIPV